MIDYQPSQFAAVRSMRRSDRPLDGQRRIGTPAFACELQRDWAREETVADVVEIVLTERLLKT